SCSASPTRPFTPSAWAAISTSCPTSVSSSAASPGGWWAAKAVSPASLRLTASKTYNRPNRGQFLPPAGTARPCPVRGKGGVRNAPATVRLWGYDPGHRGHHPALLLEKHTGPTGRRPVRSAVSGGPGLCYERLEV